ncbi:pH regulation protein F [Marinitoga lauensis]|uniref:pH regulation protein F n=1 Tax=Marinitoga lauensis TaxID=2201189 RepID=UPI0010137FDD|nr:pH regulation protein F [Marinitoga lauensis]
MIYLILDILILLSLFLMVIKLILGPTAWDRVLAFASMSSKISIISLIYAITKGFFVMIDIIIIFLVLNLWE